MQIALHGSASSINPCFTFLKAMSDRFARLKTDPRFRRPRKKEAKVVVDERFKSIFDDTGKKEKKGGSGA